MNFKYNFCMQIEIHTCTCVMMGYLIFTIEAFSNRGWVCDNIPIYFQSVPILDETITFKLSPQIENGSRDYY
jgi:hypothetical protein